LVGSCCCCWVVRCGSYGEDSGVGCKCELGAGGEEEALPHVGALVLDEVAHVVPGEWEVCVGGVE
jgi:hypothetical protein